MASTKMKSDGDDQAIRSLIATWMHASSGGDLDRVLSLMDRDVVFLGPGRPPMRGRDAFAAAAARAGSTSVDHAFFGRMPLSDHLLLQTIHLRHHRRQLPGATA